MLPPAREPKLGEEAVSPEGGRRGAAEPPVLGGWVRRVSTQVPCFPAAE